MSKRRHILFNWMLIFTMVFGNLAPASALDMPYQRITEPTAAETGELETSVSEAVYGVEGKDSVAAPPTMIGAMSSGTNKTAALRAVNTSFNVEVKQNDSTVDPSSNIHGRQAITMKVSGIKVPVHADKPEAPDTDKILQNDYIVFDKDIYFPGVNITTTGTLDLKILGEKIATASFAPTYIRIDFNGLAKFFTQANDVHIEFEVTAKGDLTGMDYGADKDIEIFLNTYKLSNPNLNPAYTIFMTHSPSSQTDGNNHFNARIRVADMAAGTITWVVNITATDRDDTNIMIPLKGLTFSDDLSDVGTYVEDSFKLEKIDVVNGRDVSNTRVEVSATANYEDNTLSYTFDDSFGDKKAIITFKTWIPKNVYYGERQRDQIGQGKAFTPVTNQSFLSGGEIVDKQRSNQRYVTFQPDWIVNNGVVSKDTNGDTLVTWTVDVNANYQKQSLQNFQIADPLPEGLEFKSATYQFWDSVTRTWSTTKQSITPDTEINGVYSFGTVNGAVRLVIVSKVADNATTSSFTTKARANWTLATPSGVLQDNDVTSSLDPPTAVADPWTVTVGAHTLTKSGGFSTDDLKIGSRTWTVSLTPQYDDPTAVVYDLLVYSHTANILDSNKLKLNSPDGNPISDELKKIVNDVRGNTGLIGQKYLPDSFETNSGLSHEVIPLYQDGMQVADLLKVTNYQGTGTSSFTFRALVTNPHEFTKQYSLRSYEAPRYNRVHLFDGDTYAGRSADSFVNRHGNMLGKGMIYASKPLQTNGTAVATVPNWHRGATWVAPAPGNINQSIIKGYADMYTLAGYDRVTKTVTFRLEVNHKGLDTVEMAKNGDEWTAKEITLVDTLPAGWDFVSFDDGAPYQLYQGYSSNNPDSNYGVGIRADTLIPQGSADDVVSSFAVDDTEEQTTGTFRFTKLTSPYVILVKARPSADRLDALIQAGVKTITETNNAELSITWGNTLVEHNVDLDVIVTLDRLHKTVNKVKDGVLEWTVDYTPPFYLDDGIYLQDTMDAGMNLRRDGFGNLLLTRPSMAVYPSTMNPDGSLTRGNALNLNDIDCEVKVTTGTGTNGETLLNFEFDDPNKIYQIVYQTEVGNVTAGTKLSNSIKLMGDSAIEAKDLSDKSEYTVDTADVGGSAGQRALLYLVKVDPDNNVLGGVEFKLFEADGITPARDRDGKPIEGTTLPNGTLPNFYIDTPGSYVLKQTYIDLTTYLPTTHEYQIYVGNTPWKPVWADGIEVTSGNPLIVPTPAAGKLSVTNEVQGNGGEPEKEFEYTIKFDEEDEEKEYAYKIFNTITQDVIESKTIKHGGVFTLKEGFTFVIEKLIAGLKYIITQTDYEEDGYTIDSEGFVHNGTIVKNGDHKEHFINTKLLTGGLLISNTVEGNAGDKNKDFEFQVDFTGSGANETYSYTKRSSSGTSEGTIESGDKVSLKHGEIVTIHGILKDTVYTVTETDYTGEGIEYGYTTAPSDRKRTGTIETSQTSEAHFVNAKYLPGSLLITNTVTGSGGDKQKDFTYTITFSDDKTYSYTGSKTGNIVSGGEIALKHGEQIVIAGIPHGVTYTVSQADYKSDGYNTTPNSLQYTGTIVSQEQANAPFVNDRQLPGTLELKTRPAGGSNKPGLVSKVPGDAKHPAELIVSLVDEDGQPVKGAEITFKHEDGTELGTATADENGVAKLEYTPPKVTDTVEKTYTFTATTTVKSPSGVPYEESNQVNVIATPAALFGILRDNKTGQVIPNAEITVTNVKTGDQVTIETDENGAYRYPVNRDEEYTITYNRIIEISGTPTSVPFTQKADTNDSEITEGKDIPADITAVGIVLFKQTDGTKALLDNTVVSKTHVYLKDGHGEYVKDSSGNPKAFAMGPSGTFSAEGLSEQEYTMEVRYQYEPGKELILTIGKIDVKADGELNITEELVDPYGTVYDETTGNEITGTKIEGAKVTLYYANTSRNIAKGITPGDKVHLPPIPGFAPNGNKSPEQDSDPNGFYAFMVFPEADYYLVVTKTGYETHTSPTISVGIEIVKYDVPMKPVSNSGGGNSGGSGGSSGGSQTPEEGSGKPFPPQIPVKPEPKPEPPKQPEVTPKPEEPKKPAENPEEPKKTEAKPKQPMLKERTLENTPIGGRVTVPERSTTEVEQPPVSGSETVKELPVNSTVSVKQPPANGTATVKDDGTWEYTPAPGFIGKDQFTITIKYPDGTKEDILIEIEVGEVPLGSTLPSGVTQLPKTGEINPFVHYVFGFAMIVIGAVLLRKSKALRGKLHS